LAHEGAAVGSDTCATAAGRVFDKLTSHLAPLVGAAGVQALFVRSAKLAKGEVACLAEASSLNSTKLRECLQAQDPALAMQSAAGVGQVLKGYDGLLTGTPVKGEERRK